MPIAGSAGAAVSEDSYASVLVDAAITDAKGDIRDWYLVATFEAEDEQPRPL
jgi:hypothetical protein